MIGIDVDVTEQFAALTVEEEKRFFREGRKAVRVGVNRLRKRIRQNLRGIGSGQTYLVNGKPHRASGPDEDPAKLTGELARSMRTRVKTKKKEGAIDGTVTPSRSQFAKAHGLEFGATVGNWHVAARSYMRRAQMQEEQNIGRDLAEAAKGE